MLGEIGTELQAKCTDENRIFHQKSLYGKNGTDGPLPDCITTGRLGMPIDWWQQRLALVVGRKIIHSHQSRQYGDEDAPISGFGPCRSVDSTKIEIVGSGRRGVGETRVGGQ